MRGDRGFFLLPEVDIGIPFTPGMSALIAAKLPRTTAHEAMITGPPLRRYRRGRRRDRGRGARRERAARRRLAAAQELTGKSAATLQTIKRRLHEDALNALRGPLGL